MKIVVFGANGRVGSLTAKELLARDHEVVAFVHGESRIAEHPRLSVVQGDVYNESDVTNALADADAVISALGSWGTSGKDVLTEGMRRIIPGAEAVGVKRVISLTGADARAPGDKLSLTHRATHALFSVTAGKVLRDGEQHMILLSESSLDWTVVRSPVMKPDEDTGYILGHKRPMPWQTIPRAAVVQSLCDLVESSKHSRTSPFITRH